MQKFFTLFLGLLLAGAQAQTVTDYDGNVYNEVQIGTQTWLEPNLLSLHYTDGTPIPDVLSYDNSDSLAAIYGRLYTWYAAMRNETTPGVQGVCPEGWHLPSHPEWSLLESFLGGASVAGGAMKETGNDHWNPPNTGATNSSGFRALAAGEHDTPNGVFQFLMRYAVFWTSTQVSTTKARERFLSYNKASCDIYDWTKTLNYSIRCVKDAATGQQDPVTPMIRIFPNPASDQLTLASSAPMGKTTLKIVNAVGQTVLVREARNLNMEVLQLDGLQPGFYILLITTGSTIVQKEVMIIE